MKSCMDIILSRASVKGYTDESPRREDLERITEAGLAAASGRNMQAPVILCITNREIRDRLSRDNAAVMGSSQDPFYNAPVVFVVLAETTAHTYVYDGSLSLGNMMLAAQEAGLGSCWIHRAKEVMAMPHWQEWIRSLGLEGNYEGIGNLVVGYPKGDAPKPKERRQGRFLFID